MLNKRNQHKAHRKVANILYKRHKVKSFCGVNISKDGIFTYLQTFKAVIETINKAG